MLLVAYIRVFIFLEILLSSQLLWVLYIGYSILPILLNMFLAWEGSQMKVYSSTRNFQWTKFNL